VFPCLNKQVEDRAHWFGIDSLQDSVQLTSIARKIVAIGFVMIVYMS